jgi:hypothetical protein
MARDKGFKDDLRQVGYSQEEEYFYRLNRELIDRKRQERLARRKAQNLRAVTGAERQQSEDDIEGRKPKQEAPGSRRKSATRRFFEKVKSFLSNADQDWKP